MNQDKLQLFKYAFIFALLIAGWFALTSVSNNLLAQLLLGWIGFGVVALYYRWLVRNKMRSSEARIGGRRTFSDERTSGEGGRLTLALPTNGDDKWGQTGTMISLNYRDSTMEFPTRQVFGAAEILWAIRFWLWRLRSKRWKVVTGRVSGREFLRFATNAGWFSVHYTHDCSSETLVGETRTWIISKKTSKAESDPDTLQASKDYPPGSEIRLRVDPREPSRSVPDSAPSRPQPGGTT
jgi:hypothetical protein